MPVKEIVIEYLKTNGFDGLFCADAGCACDIEHLMDCYEACMDCVPGYKHPCDCDDPDHEFHISAEKPETEKKRGGCDVRT